MFIISSYNESDVYVNTEISQLKKADYAVNIDAVYVHIEEIPYMTTG